MYPDEFAYHEPDTIEGVFELLETHRDEQTQLLAGGHSLLPSMKTGLASPDVLVDIGSVDELQGIERDGDRVSIGAATPYAEISTSSLLQRTAPALVEAVGEIGDEQVRNRGTIGGNVAHADPASDLQAPLLVEDAIIRVKGTDGTREIVPSDFFMGIYMTALGEHELVTGIDIPVDSSETVGVYRKKPNSASGYPIVGVAAAVTFDGETVETARIAANGVEDSVVRLDSVEATLTGQPADQIDVDDAAARVGDQLDAATLMDDKDVSPEFRLHLLEQYVTEAIRSVLDQGSPR